MKEKGIAIVGAGINNPMKRTSSPFIEAKSFVGEWVEAYEWRSLLVGAQNGYFALTNLLPLPFKRLRMRRVASAVNFKPLNAPGSDRLIPHTLMIAAPPTGFAFGEKIFPSFAAAPSPQAVGSTSKIWFDFGSSPDGSTNGGGNSSNPTETLPYLFSDQGLALQVSITPAIAFAIGDWIECSVHVSFEVIL